jgi:hypothetical protein
MIRRSDVNRPTSRELVLACLAGAPHITHLGDVDGTQVYSVNLPASNYAVVLVDPAWSQTNPKVLVHYFDSDADRLAWVATTPGLRTPLTFEGDQ